MMFSDCRMEQQVVATAEGPGYRLDVLASPMLCVDPAIAQDLWPHAGVLRVTNTSAAPAEITYQEGETGGFSFRAQRISEPRDPADGTDYDPGPVDFEAGRTVTVSIAPRATANVIGDPTYILGPIDLAQQGVTPGGAPVGAEERFVRDFRVEFFADFKLTAAGKSTAVQETMPAILRVVVRDVTRE